MRKKVVVKGITRYHDMTGGYFAKRKWVQAYLGKKYRLIRIIKQKQLSPRGEYPKTIEFTAEVEKKKPKKKKR